MGRGSGRSTVAAWAALMLAGAGCGGNSPHALANGDYQLAETTLDVEIAPAGARIVDVHLPGSTNMLTGTAVDGLNLGSTFWISPQSQWGWPPPASFDTAAYEVSGSDASLTFTGPADPNGGTLLAKRFVPGNGTATVRAEYRVTAVGGDGMFAPWEVTRVFPGGLTFYPTGSDPPRAGGGFALPPTQTGAGCTWYQHPGTAPGVDQKLLADGSGGWLAHVAGDVILVKTFGDLAPEMAAPGEAEIEIFADGQGRYVEIEEQGAYQPLPQGQTLTWPVTWIVRPLPAGLDATAGSADLVAFVQSLVWP
jgi:hypothetical protein